MPRDTVAIDLCLEFRRAEPGDFHAHVKQVRELSDFYRDNLELKSNYDACACFLSTDGTCGFAVTPDFELINVFSRVTGQGTSAVQHAKSLYDHLHLNCYDGFLAGFYATNGFSVTRREPNWLPDGPDVVFMEYSAGTP